MDASLLIKSIEIQIYALQSFTAISSMRAMIINYTKVMWAKRSEYNFQDFTWRYLWSLSWFKDKFSNNVFISQF